MKKLLMIGSCLLLSLLANNAKAAVIYWDPEGTSTATTANLAGTWNTTSSQWSTTNIQVASPTTWVSTDAACFCAGSTTVSGGFTVTLTSTISCAGLFNGPLNPPGYNVTLANGGGGAINFISGVDALDIGGSDGDPLIVNVPITGPGTACIEGDDQLYLEAPNTYTGGTLLGYTANPYSSIVNFTNGSFGTGSIIFSNASGSAMVALGSAPITIANAFSNAEPGGFNLNIVGNSAGVTFSGPWTFTSKLAGSSPVSLSSGGAANNLVNLSGIISGTNGFNKYGVGMLELSGANTYGIANTLQNSTVVSNGWLIAANTTGSATGVSSVIVTNSGTTGGGTLTGSGTISGSVTLHGGGISATNMAGGCATLTTGAQTWGTGSSNIWTINNATGTAGTTSGWDVLTINGALTIANGVTLYVESLTSANKQGALASFNNTQAYSWPIATATGGITGATNLTINTGKFANALGSGQFALSVSSNTLYLNFLQPATVTVSPTSYAVSSGGTAYINATATGADLTYAWQLNGGALTADVAGQGTPTLTISPAANADAGTYTVTVSNPLGPVSASSLLTVVNPPVFSGPAGAGQFTMSFSGPVGQTYQVWSTTDLTLTPVTSTWTLVTQGQFTSGVNTFTDTGANSTGGEYYCIIAY